MLVLIFTYRKSDLTLVWIPDGPPEAWFGGFRSLFSVVGSYSHLLYLACTSPGLDADSTACDACIWLRPRLLNV